MNNTFKLITINLFLIAMAIVGFFYGYISPIYTNDVSHITYIISGIILLNILLEVVSQFLLDTRNIEVKAINTWLTFISDKFLYIGVVGTLIGFAHMMGALSTNGSVQDAMTAIKTGCLTLGNSTLLGIVGYLWMNANAYIAGNLKD